MPTASKRSDRPKVGLQGLRRASAERTRPQEGVRRIGRRRRGFTPYLLLTPALLLFAGLFIYPLVVVVVMSFSRVSSFGDIEQFGTLEQWGGLLTAPGTWSVVGITALWAVVTVGLTVLPSFPLALALNERFPLRSIVRGLVILPWAIPVSVAAIVWLWIYNGQIGDLNYIAKSLGLIHQYVVWLGDPRSAFAAVVAVQVWTSIPFVTLTMMAGLNAIPTELYDASHIDGAGSIRSFMFITLPLLRPVTGLIILISVVWSVNGFGIIWTLTRGGPAGATMIAVMNVYLDAFQNYDPGRASAMATLLVAMLTALAWLYTRRYKVQPEES